MAEKNVREKTEYAPRQVKHAVTPADIAKARAARLAALEAEKAASDTDEWLTIYIHEIIRDETLFCFISYNLYKTFKEGSQMIKDDSTNWLLKISLWLGIILTWVITIK